MDDEMDVGLEGKTGKDDGGVDVVAFSALGETEGRREWMVGWMFIGGIQGGRREWLVECTLLWSPV